MPSIQPPLSTLLDGPPRASKPEAVLILLTVAESIREAGPVAPGTLYAMLCDRLTIQAYGQVINTLKGAGLVSESSAHMLTWIGPQFAKETK